MPHLVMPAGDTEPLRRRLVDGDDPVDLTGAAVTARAIDLAGTVRVEDRPVQIEADQTNPDSRGVVTLTWQPEDTATPTVLAVTFRVLWEADSIRRTFPREGYYSVEIVPADVKPRQLPFYPDDLAAALRKPLPLDTETADAYEIALDHAVGRVEDYLHRPILPGTYTEDVDPINLADPFHVRDANIERLLRHQPVLQVIEDLPLGGGMRRITYVGGIDARTMPAFRRYIFAEAAGELLRNAPRTIDTATTLTVEGQSVSFSAAGAAGGAAAGPSSRAGDPPKIEDLRRWRLLSTQVHTPRPPSPYRPGVRY